MNIRMNAKWKYLITLVLVTSIIVTVDSTNLFNNQVQEQLSTQISQDDPNGNSFTAPVQDPDIINNDTIDGTNDIQTPDSSSGSSTLNINLKDLASPAQPVAGADIYIEDLSDPNNNYTQRTDANGDISISNFDDSGTFKIVANTTISSQNCIILNHTETFSGGPTTFNLNLIANLTTLKVTVKDRENVAVENAEVRITDNDNTDSYVVGYTDASGVVLLEELYNNNNHWNITVNYTVGTDEYNVKNYDNYPINAQGLTDLYQQTTISNVNLTLVDLTTINLDTNSPISNVNVTLYENGTNRKIVSRLSKDGGIKFHLPWITYNFTAYYKGSNRQFKWDSGILADWQTLDLSSSGFTGYMNISTGTLTCVITLETYKFYQSGGGWSYGQGQSVSGSDIFMYFEDSVWLNFSLKTTGGSPRPSTSGSWNITRTGVDVNNSFDASETVITDSNGLYNIWIDSNDYYAGDYDYILRFSDPSIDDPVETWTIHILNRTANIEQTKPTQSPIEIPLDYNETFEVNLSSQYPVSEQITPDSSPILYFKTIRQGYTTPTESGIMTHLGSGIYSIEINVSLSKGYIEDSYSMKILGNKTNYQFVSIAIPFTVIERPAILTSIIDPTEKVSENFIKTSKLSNMTFLINFTNEPGAFPMEYSGITITAGMDGSETDLNSYIYPTVTPGIYNLTVDITESGLNTTIGMHTITIKSYKNHYQDQTLIVQTQIIEKWKTRVSPAEPPDTLPWGNNLSFVIFYECNEEPRTGQAIPGATIWDLNVSLSSGNENHFYEIYLDQTDLGSDKWGYEDLQNNGSWGPGYYRIWFNTSLVNASSDVPYYIRLTINQTEYETKNALFYVIIESLDTYINIYEEGDGQKTNINYIELNKDEIKWLDADINVSDPSSIYYQKLLTNAKFQFSVYNVSGSGELVNTTIINNAPYRWLINSSAIGEYRVEFNATLNNYTTYIDSFTYKIGTLPIDPPTVVIWDDIKVSDTSIKVAHGENLTLNLTYTLSDVTIKVLMDEIEVSGTYVYKLSSTEYNITFPVSSYTPAVYTLKIITSKAGYNNLNTTFSVFVINAWSSSLKQVELQGINYWGDNTTMIVNYTCDETTVKARSNRPLADALFSQIIVQPKDAGPIRTFTGADKGIVWGVINLKDDGNFGPGLYEIWFDTSYVNVSAKTTFYITITSSSNLYEDGSEQVLIWIEPVETEVKVRSPEVGDVDLQSVTLDLGQMLTFNCYWNITSITNDLYGTTVDGAQNTSYIIKYKENNTVVETGIIEFVLDGRYYQQIEFNIEGEFIVTFYFINENYTSHTFQFSVFVGELITPVSYTISIASNLATSQTDFKAAIGENGSFWVNFTADQAGLSHSLQIMLYNSSNPDQKWSLNSYIYYKGAGKYYITFPAATFTPYQYEISVKGSIPDYLTKETTLKFEVLSAWETQIKVLVPPELYTWNDNASSIYHYECIQDPRTDFILTGGYIDWVNISAKDGDYSFILNQDNRGTVWNWEELVDDIYYGPGYYKLTFNTSYLITPDLKFYYLTVYIRKDLYQTSNIQSYMWLSTISTDVSVPYLMATNVPPFYLDEVYPINASYFVSQYGSVYDSVNLGYSGATMTYKIYNSTNDIIQSGNLIFNSTTGLYNFELKDLEIGTYSLSISGELLNFSKTTFKYALEIEPRPLEISRRVGISRNNVVSNPINLDLVFSITLVDELTGQPLTGATVTINLGDDVLTFTELNPETAPGVYKIVIPKELFEKYNATELEVYTLPATISREGFKTENLQIQLNVELASDPIVGIPYDYWKIILISSVAMIGVVWTRHAYIQAHIPPIIKAITKADSIINKKKKAPKERIGIFYEEEIYEKFRDDWKKVGVDLSEVLDLKNVVTGKKKSITSGKAPKKTKSYDNLENIPTTPVADTQVSDLKDLKGSLSEFAESSSDYLKAMKEKGKVPAKEAAVNEFTGFTPPDEKEAKGKKKDKKNKKEKKEKKKKK